MSKLQIEICIISARGLACPSSLRKPRWFAVGWIDPNDKFCTKVDSSGSPNPSWKTRFSVPIDAMTSNLETLSLSIEVYRRESVFLGEKLEGTATIMLKEFLTKFTREETTIEETASFQLSKQSSGKPNGFVDISVRICRSGFRKGSSSPKNEISLAIEDAPIATCHAQFGGIRRRTTENHAGLAMPNLEESGGELPRITQDHSRNLAHPSPLPPSNTGFLQSPFLGAKANQTLDSFVSTSHEDKGLGFRNMPDLTAGALAAGAMIFGDDFLSTSSTHF